MTKKEEKQLLQQFIDGLQESYLKDFLSQARSDFEYSIDADYICTRKYSDILSEKKELEEKNKKLQEKTKMLFDEHAFKIQQYDKIIKKVQELKNQIYGINSILDLF